MVKTGTIIGFDFYWVHSKEKFTVQYFCQTLSSWCSMQEVEQNEKMKARDLCKNNREILEINIKGVRRQFLTSGEKTALGSSCCHCPGVMLNNDITFSLCLRTQIDLDF